MPIQINYVLNQGSNVFLDIEDFYDHNTFYPKDIDAVKSILISGERDINFIKDYFENLPYPKSGALCYYGDMAKFIIYSLI